MGLNIQLNNGNQYVKTFSYRDLRSVTLHRLELAFFAMWGWLLHLTMLLKKLIMVNVIRYQIRICLFIGSVKSKTRHILKLNLHKLIFKKNYLCFMVHKRYRRNGQCILETETSHLIYLPICLNFVKNTYQLRCILLKVSNRPGSQWTWKE